MGPLGGPSLRTSGLARRISDGGDCKAEVKLFQDDRDSRGLPCLNGFALTVLECRGKHQRPHSYF